MLTKGEKLRLKRDIKRVYTNLLFLLDDGKISKKVREEILSTEREVIEIIQNDY
jgi:hypothetical protein